MTLMVTEIRREHIQRFVAEGGQLIDVLPREDFEREHIPGAISIPLGRLATESGQLQRDRAVIVYCHDYQ